MLQISQNLETFVPSNYRGDLKLIYNTQSANPNGIVQMRKAKVLWNFDINFWLTQLSTGTVVFKFQNPSNTLNFEFHVSTTGNNRNDRYNVVNTPPAGTPGTQWIYIDDLVACFIASPLAEYYDIRAVSLRTSANGVIEFEEKEIGLNGSNGLLIITATKNGASVTMPTNTFSQMFGRNGFNNYNQNIHLRILVEKSPNFWVEIYKKVNNIGNRISTYELEYTFGGLAFIMRDYLAMHPMNDSKKVLTNNELFKKFKIEYWVENQQSRTKGSSNSIYPSIQYAILANIYDKYNIKPSLKIYEKHNIVLNNYHQNRHFISPNQPAYFSVLNVLVQSFGLAYYFSDGTVQNFYLPENTNVNNMGIWHIPAWLHYTESFGDVKVTKIELWQEAANVQESVMLCEYIIDYSYQANQRWYVYLNALGGLDSLSAYEMDNQSMSIEKSTFVSKYREILNHVHHKTKFVVNSNFIDSLHVDNYKDMLTSRFVYEVDQDTIRYNGYGGVNPLNAWNVYCKQVAVYRVNYWPIIIESKDISIVPAENNLSLVKFDYRFDEVDTSGFGANKSTNVNIDPNLPNQMYSAKKVYNNFFINSPEVIKFTLRLRKSEQLIIRATGSNHYLRINGVDQDLAFNNNSSAHLQQYSKNLIRTRENDTVVVEFGGYLIDILEFIIAYDPQNNLPSVMAFSLVENTTIPLTRVVFGFFEMFDETANVIRAFPNSNNVHFIDASVAIDQMMMEILRIRGLIQYKVINQNAASITLSPFGQILFNEINSNSHPSTITI
jgi:hypothetical protein